jgi:DNA invertase Pin-like site-specific DNA recombinase
METMKYVAYYRVSTQKQGKSGLGLEVQVKMVADFVKNNGGQIIAEYKEVESGKHDDRPELMKAMKHASLVGGRLLVGKLDRLSRDLHFITSLQKSRVDFVVSDMPGCDSFTINIYGALAQREREMISARTKAGLAVAKARGVKLGTNNLRMDMVKEASAKGVLVRQQNALDFAAKVKPVIEAMKTQGKSLRAIAAELDNLGVKTARGCQWTATAVRNVLLTTLEVYTNAESRAIELNI